jgi:hypothetical protein
MEKGRGMRIFPKSVSGIAVPHAISRTGRVQVYYHKIKDLVHTHLPVIGNKKALET